MSSSRFKKDKEIIADYETQVKGERVFVGVTFIHVDENAHT